jgi:hypothetical protein
MIKVFGAETPVFQTAARIWEWSDLIRFCYLLLMTFVKESCKRFSDRQFFFKIV